MDKIRWGILGTGTIAGKFAEGLALLPDAELTAVGSRAQETADTFGHAFGVPRRHGSYEALSRDPEVDVVYVASPHVGHKDHGILCLNAGKAVLCEKPLTINADEARALVSVARDRKVFLMEAMWTRFIPLVCRLRELLAEGVIGDVRLVRADFGGRAEIDPQSRLFDRAVGGGALLDIGVYCVSFASMVLGAQPQRIASIANIGETDVDEEAGMIFGYAGGAMAVLFSAIRTATPQAADILGAEGGIEIDPPFWHAQSATLVTEGRRQKLDVTYEGNGYQYEAVEVGRCLREGKLESDVMSLDESVAVMETMDRVRAQWGLKYPTE